MEDVEEDLTGFDVANFDKKDAFAEACKFGVALPAPVQGAAHFIREKARG